jgi:TPP-dependent indolepyruvate ferredoxin oxidoreductase alpha subunit
MPDDEARANIGCFAEQVLPALQAVDTGVTLGASVAAGAGSTRTA